MVKKTKNSRGKIYIKCLLCGKERAIRDPLYGYLPGNICQRKQKEFAKIGTTAEITTDDIKESRKVFENDIVQPFNDGQLSKEYVEAHPERVAEMLKEGNVTVKEINEAKSVWDLSYYKKE